MALLTIENLFNYEDFEYPINPGITLITGKNSAGKTNIASTIAALVAHYNNPLHLDAGSLKAYVMDGQQEGMASLGDITWSPPQNMSIPPGQNPRAGPSVWAWSTL